MIFSLWVVLVMLSSKELNHSKRRQKKLRKAKVTVIQATQTAAIVLTLAVMMSHQRGKSLVRMARQRLTWHLRRLSKQTKKLTISKKRKLKLRSGKKTLRAIEVTQIRKKLRKS